MPSTASARSRAEFAARAVAALTPLGPVAARPMFGGHGLFLDDAMIALTSAGELWLKGDGDCRDLFLEGGARPFVYRRQGKPVELSFYSVPPEVWADPPRLVDWGTRAHRAALRALADRKQRRRR